MSISISRYVDITSGVGGSNTVTQRELIGRLFTTNPLLPTGSFGDFTSAADVGTYFGTSSDEYRRAQFYFGWISKNISRAKKLSFARYNDIDTAPIIYGRPGAQSLSAWQAITNGSLRLTIGGVTANLTGLNFSTATSLANVATILQTAIRGQTGAQFTGATVAYDAIGRRFTFTGGATGAATIAVAAGTTGTDVAGPLGWLSGATLSNGAVAQAPIDAFIQSASSSNNFGSFEFIPTLSLDQHVLIAGEVDSRNVEFQYMVPVTADNAETWSAALLGFAGTALTVVDRNLYPNQYPEMIPMVILAATDYTKRNSVQNYMFQQFPGVTPLVTSNAQANVFDLQRVNYYGRTQTGGQFIEFYQRGVLMGGSNDPVDMNTYANEQWLKDAMASAVMSLLLTLSRVSANATGQGQVLAILQSGIDDALFNGTISVGKTLTQLQKVYITELSGDENAWRQVENIGYWVDCVISQSTTSDGRVEYKAVYQLIYSKDDAIRKVEGTHTLI